MLLISLKNTEIAHGMMTESIALVSMVTTTAENHSVPMDS